MRKHAITQLIGFFSMPFSLLMFIVSILGKDSFLIMPLAITILLVANIMILVNDASKNIIFIVFQGMYFLFLIGGPLLDALDGTNYFSEYSDEIVRATYACYWLAAFTMWCYFMFKNSRKNEITVGFGKRNDVTEKNYDIDRIKSISRLLFYISITAYFAIIRDKVFFRQSFSMSDYYALYGTSSNLPTIIVKIGDCHLIALAMFLATKPTRKEAKIPLILFVVASAMTLLYGVRNVILLNLVFLIIYFVLRNSDEEVWFTKKTGIVIAIALPFVMIFMQAFVTIRNSIAFNVFDVKEVFSLKLVRDFFEAQSISTKILPNAMVHYSQLGGQPVPYTFGTLYTYLRQNMIVRFFTGAAVYNANSVESAMSGGSLGARLAYYMYRETFLTGTGMGGSYVADLFVDFSYIGVSIGTIIACMIGNKMSKIAMGGRSPYALSFVLVAVRWFVYMPRDSYFSWAMQAFSFMNIIFVLMVMLLSRTKMSVHASRRVTDS